MRLGLSFERDRLLTISGIARFLFSLGDKRLPDGSYAIIDPKIERKFGQSVEYFAGLNRTHWIAHLLWYPDLGGCTAMKSASTLRQEPDPESFKRCPDDSDPSWSWAACPGPLQWTFLNYNRPRTGEVPKRDGEPLACLRKNHFEPLGSDAYGLPKSASLDISCLLIQAMYTEFDGPEDVQKRLEKSVDHIKDKCFEWYTDGFILPLPYPRRHSDEQSVIAVPFEPCDSFTATCFVMPLYENRGFDSPMMTGLVVQEKPRADGTAKEFVRIGSFTQYHYPKDRAKDRRSMGVINTLLKNIPIDGGEFEQKLREHAQEWKEDESLGTMLSWAVCQAEQAPSTCCL
ncbi:hypothetical protein NXS19_002812 [Fusarium pseudograminearum]|nr:hypothetical protein NXS19_002812 [Fusarium pseudograminearum]